MRRRLPMRDLPRVRGAEVPRSSEAGSGRRKRDAQHHRVSAPAQPPSGMTERSYAGLGRAGSPHASPPDMSVVIAGAGQAGFQTAVSLRAAGYLEPITLIGEEPYLPYQRPPLSKGFLLGKQG